jgi:hypothetical protein
MRINVDDNWLVNNSLLFTANFVCDFIYHLSCFLKVIEFLARNFFKSTPWFCFFSKMVESKLSRPSCNNTLEIINFSTSPRGKKSIPTIDSNTEDFPELYVPKTAILGKLMYCYRPTSLSSS